MKSSRHAEVVLAGTFAGRGPQCREDLADARMTGDSIAVVVRLDNPPREEKPEILVELGGVEEDGAGG